MSVSKKLLVFNNELVTAISSLWTYFTIDLFKVVHKLATIQHHSDVNHFKYTFNWKYEKDNITTVKNWKCFVSFFFLTIQARKTFHKIPLTQFMPILCGLYNTFLNICIALALFSPLAIIIFKQVLMRVNWLKNWTSYEQS